MNTVASLPANMAAKVKVHPITDCWEWQAAKNSKGYGSVTDGTGKSMLAHRRAYQELVGPIPAGLTIDHLCRNKVCVNPDHMEPVTGEENTARKVYGHRFAWVAQEPLELQAVMRIDPWKALQVRFTRPRGGTS